MEVILKFVFLYIFLSLGEKNIRLDEAPEFSGHIYEDVITINTVITHFLETAIIRKI